MTAQCQGEIYQWKSLVYARCVWSISGQLLDACLLWMTVGLTEEEQ